jgi:DNA helicase-2/ATP-dependent DNA helicase PcrA
MFQPRSSQKEVLAYESGLMAVSAVPGSGKTVTLAGLAAKLLANGIPEDGTVLVVTYMNAAVDNLSHRIRQQLDEIGVAYGRYDIRTLHSLAREIVLEQPGLAGVVPGFPVLDERTSLGLLERATETWLDRHPQVWDVLLEQDNSAHTRQRWRQRISEMVRSVVKEAKNHRWRAPEILSRLAEAGFSAFDPLWIAAEIYHTYQSYVETTGGLDFDDLVWQAVDLLEAHPDLLSRLRRRWPFVLEDEAQDSVPLQEDLLSLLAGPQGNWVRVGDPNQAITSTFTAAHPRYFRTFMERGDVYRVTMSETGRCAPKIMALANHLVDWICREHPLPEIRERAFLLQSMEAVSSDDPQPNPPDQESDIAINSRGYAHREQKELPRLADLLKRYRRRFPQHTLGVLVPTNEVGYRMGQLLTDLGVPYDELLESSSQTRGVAGILAALLSFAADPLSREALSKSLELLVDLGERLTAEVGLNLAEEQERGRLSRLLYSRITPDLLLFPEEGEDPLDALPAGRATNEDLEILAPLFELLRTALRAAPLPVDQLVLVLATELFSRPADLATAQQIASYLRHLTQVDPALRLPELAEEMGRISQGRRFVGLTDDDWGFEPQPGRITVATQHRAKGLEWDLVCLVGVDRYWIPFDLSQTFQGTILEWGGNPTALVQAQLCALMQDPERQVDIAEATREANLETIAERLRLLYVGITRARRHLQIGWSQVVEIYGRDRPQEATPVLKELARSVKLGSTS